MNKKGGLLKYSLAFILIISISISYLVLADHIIKTSTGGTTYNVNEDMGFIYNITVNNTDINTSANITQVNITLPSTFSLVTNSNGTDSAGTFTNSSNILSWNNLTYFLINGSENKYFWFNATASTPGTYNLTVTTTNITGVYSSNISITINDTTSPELAFVNPTPTDGSSLSQSNIALNITATDNVSIDTITLRLYNSSNSQINSSTSLTSPLFFNFTNLTEGIYYINATANDTTNNINNTDTITITLDTTPPSLSISLSSITSSGASLSVTTNETATCNYSGAGSGSLGTGTSLSGTLSGLTSSATYTISVNCNDSAGNTRSGSSSFTTSSTSSSSAGSSTASSYWTSTHIVSDEQFEEGYTRELARKKRLRIKIDNKNHYVGVISLTETKATINISSDPIQVILDIGAEEKFDLTDDNYYDLLVKLNSIEDNKANITIQNIHEEIPIATSISAPEEDKNATIGTVGETANEITNFIKNKKLWSISIIIAIIVIAVIVFLLTSKRKRYYLKGY